MKHLVEARRVLRGFRSLASYRTDAAQPGAWLAPRRHSLVLRCCFGIPVVCCVGGIRSNGQASRRDPDPGPRRPGRGSTLGAGSSPLATVQADRGTACRFGGRPPDRGDASPPLGCPGDVFRLVRAARAISVKPAVMSIGRCSSRTSRPRDRRLARRRDRRHPAGPGERNHEQAGMVEYFNHPGPDRQRAHRLACPRKARPTLAPRPRRGMRSISASMSRSSH
jgi:hypothetical protein